MTDSDEHAIVVESLTKRYRDLLAVDDVSFTVRKGEVFAFVGPNGAGKTTTVEIIETIRTPTSGQVRVLGMDVARQKRDIVPRIGVLPQGFSSFDRITVSESIGYYAKLFGGQRADIEGLMDLTNLKDKRDVQFRHLSGGLKQRLGIAIALVNDPTLIPLMDALDIDAYINPRATTVSSILRHVRHGRVRALYSIGDAEAEVIEAQVLGTSPLAGRLVRDIAFPEGVLVGALMKGDRVLKPAGDLRVEEGDVIALFVMAKDVPEVERLLQVSIDFS